MERLADKIFLWISQELGLSRFDAAWVIGCAMAFADKPRIEATYILRRENDTVIGGILYASFKRGILGEYTINVLQNSYASLDIKYDELKKIGLDDAKIEQSRTPKTVQLIDDHRPWLLIHMDGSKSFAENVDPDFEKHFKEMVLTGAKTL